MKHSAHKNNNFGQRKTARYTRFSTMRRICPHLKQIIGVFKYCTIFFIGKLKIVEEMVIFEII